MARRRSHRAVVTAAVVVAASAALSCGGESSPKPAARLDPQDPPNLVTTEYLRAALGGRPCAGPESTVLRFWRDVQFLALPSAYARLTPQLRDVVAYDDFKRATSRAHSFFLVRPRLLETERRGDRASVYLQLQAANRPRPDDPPLAFNLHLQSGRWLISTDPANVLGTPAGRVPGS